MQAVPLPELPAYLHARLGPNTPLIIRGMDRRPRYCAVCTTLKPDRCHHCRTCDRCVLKMDHHCFCACLRLKRAPDAHTHTEAPPVASGA
jgi:hypothetical protein